MRVVERSDTFVAGIEVVAHFDDLHTAVPEAWRALFRREDVPVPPDGSYAEASVHLGDGRYRETVGLVLGHPEQAPPGMSVARVPAGRFVHHRHDGAVGEIAGGFQAMYDWADAHGLHLGAVKLDLGYTDDGSYRPHDLYADISGGASSA